MTLKSTSTRCEEEEDPHIEDCFSWEDDGMTLKSTPTRCEEEEMMQWMRKWSLEGREAQWHLRFSVLNRR